MFAGMISRLPMTQEVQEAGFPGQEKICTVCHKIQSQEERAASVLMCSYDYFPQDVYC